MAIKVGIIGTNFGRSFHLPAFQNHPKFELVGISGNNKDKTKQIAQKNSIVGYNNWEDLVKDSSIDLVSVATPPYLHFEMAKTVLESGKHILLEKPTCSNSTQARELVKIASENHLTGMLAHEWRYYELNQQINQLLHSRDLVGKIHEMRVQDLLSYAYNDTYSWEYDKTMDGGWVGIAGSHIVDLIRYLTNGEFREITGHTHIRYQERKDKDGISHSVTAEDAFSSIFNLDNGIEGIIDHLPTLKPAPSSRMIISGEKGTIYTEGSNILIPEIINFAPFDGEFSTIHTQNNDHDISRFGIEKVMHLLFQQLLTDLSWSINMKEDKSPSLVDGWKNQQVLDAIRKSAHSGMKIKID
ncbi:MAG: Gfo/Idh/MocA family protein [Candidatus Kariarchaeaceae archaeon]